MKFNLKTFIVSASIGVATIEGLSVQQKTSNQISQVNDLAPGLQENNGLIRRGRKHKKHHRKGKEYGSDSSSSDEDYGNGGSHYVPSDNYGQYKPDTSYPKDSGYTNYGK